LNRKFQAYHFLPLAKFTETRRIKTKTNSQNSFSGDLHSKLEVLLSLTHATLYYAVSLIHAIDHDQAQIICSTAAQTQTPKPNRFKLTNHENQTSIMHSIHLRPFREKTLNSYSETNKLKIIKTVIIKVQNPLALSTHSTKGMHSDGHYT